MKVLPDQTFHVWPDSETNEHVLHGTSCECIPKLRHFSTGTRVTHHSLAISLSRRKVK